MGDQLDLESIVAVIPVYKAPAGLVDRVGLIAAQVDRVVLVDDGTHSISSEQFSGMAVDVLLLDENCGIACALNVGVRQALAGGATHILTLDQDSTPRPSYVAQLLQRLGNTDGATAGVAVPAIVGGAAVLRSRDARFAFDPVQSGQLIPARVLADVGEFDESLFIDAVDSDFTIRVRAAGYEFWVEEAAALEHGLGELVPITFFGRPLVVGGRARNVLYHAPFRTYYMTRNSVVLMRRYGWRIFAWTWRRTGKLAEMVIGCVVLAPDRGRQVRAVVAGVRDGVRGRTGRVSSAVLESIGTSGSKR